MELYQNHVKLNQLCVNSHNHNYRQSGGAKYVNITIVYCSHDHPSIISDMYVVLDDMSAYKMNNVIVSKQFAINLSVQANKFFKFKFLKNNKLEILDEDIVLRQLSDVYPTVGDLNVVDDLNKCSARWRWIFPTENEIKPIYFFTYYLPYYDNCDKTDRSLNKIADDTNLLETDVTIKNKFAVKPNNNTVVVKNSSGKVIDRIALPEILLNDNVDDIKEKLVEHNLDSNGNNYNNYVRTGVRNENILMYYNLIIRKDVRLVHTQLQNLTAHINELNALIKTTSGKSYEYNWLTKSANAPNQIAKSNNLNYYPLMYNVKIDPTLKQYVLFLNGLKIEFKSNVHLEINNELIDVIDRIGLIFINYLSNITANCFSELPLSILNYIEFFKKYKQTSENYAVKCLFLYCYNNSNCQIQTNDCYLHEFKVNDVAVSTNPNSDGNKKLQEIYNTYSHIIQPHINPLNKILLNMDYLRHPKIKFLFNNVNEKHILTMDWLIKNLMHLVYVNNTAIGDPIIVDYNDGTSDNSCTLIKLQNLIKNNITSPSFYDILNKFYLTASNYNTLSLYNGTNRDAYKIELNGDFKFTYDNAEYMNPIIDRIIKEASDMNAKILDKIIHVDSHVYFIKYENINEFMLIFKDKIKLFGNSFWLNLNDMTFDDFYNNLSELNKDKIQYIFAHVLAYLQSDLLETPIDMSDVQNVPDRSAIEFFNLINKNEYLNKLFKLARYHSVVGNLLVDMQIIVVVNNIETVLYHIDGAANNDTKNTINKLYNEIGHKTDSIDLFTMAELTY